MNNPEEILAAHASNRLLATISASSHDQFDALACTLSDLHNAQRLDFLSACRSNQLDGLTGPPFFVLQQVFCRTLPKLNCTIYDAATTCNMLFAKAGRDVMADSVHEAFREWLRASRQRVEDGLELARSDTDNQVRITRLVLLEGARFDLKRFGEQALSMTYNQEEHLRLDAFRALGSMGVHRDERLLDAVISRLEEFIDPSVADDHCAIALEATLRMLDQGGDIVQDVAERALQRACRIDSPSLRHVIAVSLLQDRTSYSDRMVEDAFTAIKCADKHAPRTIEVIDSILYQLDLDVDRRLVLDVLASLLTYSEHPITLDALRLFRHKTTQIEPNVLGWYVVSLLLTGNPRLCLAAVRLLRADGEGGVLDVDLMLFDLDDKWLLYLARKVLGYCLSNMSGAAALMLACLRVVSDDERSCLEKLTLDYLLMNYPGALELMMANIGANDPARESVDRLSEQIAKYLDDIGRHGTCDAFRPSELARQLQGYRQADLFQTMWKEAEKQSVISQIVSRATVLYGTGTIAYLYEGESSDPHRQELSFSSFNQTIEIPRLEVLDPVGLRNAIHQFRFEAPPS